MKRFFLAALAALLTLSFSSCAYIQPTLNGQHGRVTVTFVDGDSSVTETFSSSSAVKYPTKNAKGNESFSGWYYDPSCNVPVMTGDVLTGEVTLYAGYSIDLESLTNEIFSSCIKANVEIDVKSVQGGFFGNSASSRGSGAIFAEDTYYYYLLTNDHVVTAAQGYTVISYTAYDAYGNEYPATLLGSSSEYDLAVMRIPKGEEELFVLKLATAEAEQGDFVCAIGQPEGMKNSVTYGNVIKVDVFDGGAASSDEADIDFPIIWHDAPVDHGSSGGMLLNSSLELVGLNFAIGTSEDDGFICGFAIGIEEIIDFIASLHLNV